MSVRYNYQITVDGKKITSGLMRRKSLIAFIRVVMMDGTIDLAEDLIGRICISVSMDKSHQGEDK